VIEAAQKRESAQWEIGDALVRAVGMGPSNNGVNDGSLAVFEEISVALEQVGINHDAKYLSQLRTVSWVFPRSERSDPTSWSVHYLAGSPNMLKRIIARAAAKNMKLSAANVRALRKEIKEGMPTDDKLFTALTDFTVGFQTHLDGGTEFQSQEARDLAIQRIHETIDMLHKYLKSLGNSSILKVVGE
jgi:hypothetical protein